MQGQPFGGLAYVVATPDDPMLPDSTPWVELLRRVFGVDGLACPQCGQAMTLRTVFWGWW